MIVLFNSGYRELYRLNVLNTLHIPSGAENIYRYSSRPGYDYVDPALKVLAGAKILNEVQCMVIFVDRSDPQSFRFLPLRRGIVTSISEENQQYRFAVRLEEYIYARVPDGFTDAILNLCGKDAPSPGPADHAVGYFAKALEDLSQLGAFTISDQTSWATTADSLLALPCFGDSTGTSYIFTKLDHANPLGSTTWFEGSHYTVSLSYRCHDDGSPSSRVRELELMMPGVPITLCPSRIPLSGAYDTVSISVYVPTLPSATVSRLIMRRADESPVALADGAISICVKKRVMNLIMGSFYILVFGLSSAILFMKEYNFNEILSFKGLLTTCCIIAQVLSLAAISFRLGRPIK